MKFFLLFLITTSTLFASTGLVLASGVSERTNAFQFDSAQRYLSANSTIEQANEERKLSKSEIITAFEEFLPRLSGFSYESIKNYARRYFTIMESIVHQIEYHPDPNEFIISSFFTRDFLEELRNANLCSFKEYIDIALYLILLEKVGGDTMEAAKQINNAMKSLEKREIAFRMEDGQFHLWSHAVETEDLARTNIFESRSDVGWRNKVLKRYQEFLADEEKRRLPGMT